MARPTRGSEGGEPEDRSPVREEDADGDLIDKRTFHQWFTVLEDRFGKEMSDLTAMAYRRVLSEEMGTDLYVVAVQRVFRYNEFFPSPEEIIEEARKLRRAKRAKIERRRAIKRAEREKRRMAKEAQELFPDALLKGRRIARAVKNGELDLGESLGNALPPGEEERYESAGRFEAETNRRRLLMDPDVMDTMRERLCEEGQEVFDEVVDDAEAPSKGAKVALGDHVLNCTECYEATIGESEEADRG